MTRRVLSPCVDDKEHKFTDSRPPEGSYGHMVIYCTRCGATRNQLLRNPLGINLSND